jgi:hypothetical protein
MPQLGETNVRLGSINATDEAYPIRDGSSIGAVPPPYEPRAGAFLSLTVTF